MICCTCSRTLAVSSGIVTLSARQPDSPALTNFTATPIGLPTTSSLADGIVAQSQWSGGDAFTM